MDSKYYGLIEMGFVFSLVLAWGFWELYALRRDRKKTDADRKNDGGDNPPGQSQHPLAEKSVSRGGQAGAPRHPER